MILVRYKYDSIIKTSKIFTKNVFIYLQHISQYVLLLICIKVILLNHFEGNLPIIELDHWKSNTHTYTLSNIFTLSSRVTVVVRKALWSNDSSFKNLQIGEDSKLRYWYQHLVSWTKQGLVVDSWYHPWTGAVAVVMGGNKNNPTRTPAVVENNLYHQICGPSDSHSAGCKFPWRILSQIYSITWQSVVIGSLPSNL